MEINGEALLFLALWLLVANLCTDLVYGCLSVFVQLLLCAENLSHLANEAYVSYLVSYC